jgi:DNA-binding NarL/FixJ family response regulator
MLDKTQPVSDHHTPKLRILLVDDHAVVREALATLLGLETNLNVISQASTAAAALKANAEHQPDVILLDYQLAEGASSDIIAKLVQTEHKPKVLMLSSFAAHANVFAALDAGASGYLLKSSPANEVFAAIRSVASGAQAFSTELHVEQRPASARGALTKREVDVLQHIALGLSNEGIAQALHLSVGTVKSHVHNLLEKLGAQSRTEAIARARARGVIAS